MRKRTRDRLIIAGCGLIGVILGIALYSFGTRMLAPEPKVVAKSPAHNAPRLWVSADDYINGAKAGPGYAIRSVLNVRKRMRFGDYLWNDAGVAQGRMWVRVDLQRQLISVFRDGHEIGTAVILYGAVNKPTPAGTFTVLQKAEDYHSITYDAPMPYMLRLTADGVAIHASEVSWGKATHGCIGVPSAFARRLYGAMGLGDQVTIIAPVARLGVTPANSGGAKTGLSPR